MVDPLLNKFGRAVSDSRGNQVQLTTALRETCRSTAIDEFVNGEIDSHKLHEKETRLWDLIADLFDQQLPATETVTKWVSSNLNEVKEPIGLVNKKWKFTSASANEDDIITDIDIDAPLRQSLGLKKEDFESDRMFYKYVFELLIRNEYDAAIKACEKTSNWTLQALLSTFVTSNFSLPPQALDICRKMAEFNTLIPGGAVNSNQPAISDFERGVYAFICRDIAPLAPLCDSWEVMLYVFLQLGYTLSDFKIELQNHPQLINQENQWFYNTVISLLDNTFTDYAQKLVDEFQFVYASQNTMEMDINKLNSCTLIENPWLARIILHVQMCIPNTPISEPLVRLYIEILCLEIDQLPIRLVYIPEYVKLLPADEQVTVYGSVISRIDDDNDISNQIQLAKSHQIELEPVLNEAMRINFEALTDSEPEFESMELARRVIYSTKAFILAELWVPACDNILKLYETFLKANNLEAVILLNGAIDRETLRTSLTPVFTLSESDDLLSKLSQVIQYSRLASAYKALHQCSQLQRPLTGWTVQIDQAVEQSMRAVYEALLFTGPAEIRNKCIPELVYKLIDVLDDARTLNSKWERSILDLSVKVADEERQLYKLFDIQFLNKLVVPFLDSLKPRVV